MNDINHMRSAVYWSARRALSDQTPANLRAYSFSIDLEKKEILLRAHFASPPSEADLDDISLAETEIMADFCDPYDVSTDVAVVPFGHPLLFLPDGIAYLRAGEPSVIGQ